MKNLNVDKLKAKRLKDAAELEETLRIFFCETEKPSQDIATKVAEQSGIEQVTEPQTKEGGV